MEDLELVELLADADELDRHAGDRDDRQGRPAPGVAVELGQDERRQPDPLGEGLGALDRVLAGHGVADVNRLDRGEDVLDELQLIHQLVVDVEAAGRVDEQQVVAAVAGLNEEVAQAAAFGLAIASAVIS